MFTGPSFTTPRARRRSETLQADSDKIHIVLDNQINNTRTPASELPAESPRSMKDQTSSAGLEVDIRLGTLCDIELPPKGSKACNKMRDELKKQYKFPCVRGTGCVGTDNSGSSGFESGCDLRSSDSDWNEVVPQPNWDIMLDEVPDISAIYS